MPLLAALPERERRILLLRFFGGLTQTEIGLQIGISQMHVSRLLSRTLARLRHALLTDRPFRAGALPARSCAPPADPDQTQRR